MMNFVASVCGNSTSRRESISLSTEKANFERLQMYYGDWKLINITCSDDASAWYNSYLMDIGWNKARIKQFDISTGRDCVLACLMLMLGKAIQVHALLCDSFIRNFESSEKMFRQE